LEPNVHVCIICHMINDMTNHIVSSASLKHILILSLCLHLSPLSRIKLRLEFGSIIIRLLEQLKPEFIHVILQISVPTSKKTHHASITQSSRRNLYIVEVIRTI
jgi:hypothetical protein